MTFKGPFLLYGAGREARSTCTFLKREFAGAEIFVTNDAGSAELEGARAISLAQALDLVEKSAIATLVKSPGVPPSRPLVVAAKKSGLTVTSNLNLWAQSFARPEHVIVITGTKGKSTTATLLFDMLKNSGLDAGLAGNVGVAPLEAKDEHSTMVFELSSYQTADMDFAADIVAVTSLFPEHTDWHGTTERYFADKLRVLDLSPAAKLVFGPQAAVHPLIAARNIPPDRLIAALPDDLDGELSQLGSTTRLKGQHNLENARIAARIAVQLGASAEAILDAVRNFAPLRHRLEPFTAGGKLFVNDSISTTPPATIAALEAYFGKRIALIAGGFDRGQDYAELARTIAKSGVSLVICLPDTGARLATLLKSEAPNTSIVETPDLESAMRAAQLRRSHFDTLVLSPGAPSFNQFKNFEERGDRFIALARSLFV